jgi:hypothetical protein
VAYKLDALNEILVSDMTLVAPFEFAIVVVDLLFAL